MKQSVAIFGGGPAALLCAAHLDTSKFDVTIYEKNKTLGRKFLVAGKGGFNLTHSENIEGFIERYTPSSFLREALTQFSNTDLQNWLKEIDIPTFVGSSKRIYPEKQIKPIEVLNAILSRLKENGVNIKTEHEWTDFTENIDSNYNIFAFGGGSWKITGSNGNWLNKFKSKGISAKPFLPSNCAFKIDWNKGFIAKNEGIPLKNISISCGSKTQRGEIVITQFGLEGNAIYALSPELRNELKQNKKAEITIDFKPTLSENKILEKLSNSSEKNITSKLRKTLKLSSTQVDLLKAYLSKDDFLNLNSLTHHIKYFVFCVIDIAPIDEAISTVGGIDLSEVNESFELKKLPQHYCIGEMLDWDAPTGGYLLQACFSMGVLVARNLNALN